MMVMKYWRCVKYCSSFARFFGDAHIGYNSIYYNHVQSSNLTSLRLKHSLDYSRFPEISESDLMEQFIRGHGPGGSNVNKASNCVLLKHLPTGIVVKCHESRLLQKNREKAREILRLKVDDHLNGEMSITAQKKKMDKEKLIEQQKKAEKLRTLKREFKGKTDEL